ncbi:protein PLASTID TRANSCRIPTIONALLY ACTIVE 10 isoform X2 [Dioscorea cayenensis subsp. rotundata]|uniref:Protein PLASTID TRANSCRIPTIONALLY ACTIVE 10 isoform X1 n=1 Tax=Dioscorea cayennensis subsp. rotundata TaxID=55577 RepID=A0AB40B2I4_DIOCR|nr:protein PLASTID TRANSCRIPTIONALLY ACTIVE 10 isoform X1 [Dioscorea cayenensis subsp. rotundata]XP_039120900.1 protein PLASTID TRANSCRIPTIONALLY ACTIVE 10 isoform X2 [Dioscorea cayenensis subsp. rotundata]
MHCFQLHHHHCLLPRFLSPPFRASKPSVEWRSLRLLPRSSSTSSAYAPDEDPVDEDFLKDFKPREKETEDEARRRNWIERGWAPWEEILTPEADFARKALNEGEEVPLQSPEAIEAHKMLTPSYRRKKMEESGLSEEEYQAKQFEIKGEIPEPLETSWDGPLVTRLVPPRDWPPRGWEVDKKELEFIREAHKMLAERVDVEKMEGVRVDKDTDVGIMCLDRYKVFLKQYNEWVAANKDRLEEESYKFDQDYYPGRRKRGKDYKDGMLELPFFYPGQVCMGKVVTLHLHQGAFVDIGGVYDGWVPIKGNDWYWIRHHVKVGMRVIVEILAKRDPYRFRFPLEMRLVDPNIDHLLFNRFDYPPIFHRKEDTNPEELWRDCGRAPIPRRKPKFKIEEQSLLSNHPYVDKLWHLHNAEQLILDDEDANPDKYKDKKPLKNLEPFDEENSVEYTKAYFKKALIPKVILNTNVEELELDAARAERQMLYKLKKEANERGEEFKLPKLRRMIEMDEYDLMHWRRSLEEREALIRDISSRKALGLPLDEPGRYIDERLFMKDKYDPSSPLYRYDYWGEPKNSEKSRQQRETENHNKAIVGNRIVWYEMSYEEAMKQKMRREARKKAMPKVEEKEVSDQGDKDDEDEDEDEIIYSILSDALSDSENKPFVNGTESPRMADEGMFEN